MLFIPEVQSWLYIGKSSNIIYPINRLSPEKAMAPHSSTLAWKIPWTEEPGRLQSMGSQRDGHDWATSLSLFTFMHWRRKWQPTPVLLPGKFHGRRSLVGYSSWGCKELDTTERINFVIDFQLVDDDSVSQVILTQFYSLENMKHIYLWFQREILTREIFFSNR